MADTVQVRMTSGEKLGQLLEVEEAVARAWVAAGKAVEPGVSAAPNSFVAMTSVDSPTEDLRDTNTTGAVEYEEMHSVTVDEQAPAVAEVAEVQETPEKPKRRRRSVAEEPETR